MKNLKTARKTTCHTLAFQKINLIHMNHFPMSINRNNNGQTDGYLRRRNRHNKKNKNLTINGVKIMRKCHKINIGSIKHQLNGKENNNNIPADENTHNTKDKNDGTQNQIIIKWNHSPEPLPLGEKNESLPVVKRI